MVENDNKRNNYSNLQRRFIIKFLPRKKKDKIPF